MRRLAPARAPSRPVMVSAGLALVAAACTLLKIPGLRVAGGLALCLFLPGWLALLAIGSAAEALGARTRVVLAVALSLVATIAVGLVLALATRRVPVPGVVLALTAGCLAAAVVAAARGSSGRPPAAARDRPRPRIVLLALVPLVAASLLFGVMALRAYDTRDSTSYFTELSIQRRGPAMEAVAVSRERGVRDFRYQVLQDRRVLANGVLTLRPGQTWRIALPAPSAHRLEVDLLLPGSATPYRHVTEGPATP